MFFYGFAVNYAAVADRLAAEKYRCEGEKPGHFLASCVAFRYFSLAVAVAASAASCKRRIDCGFCPLAVIPSLVLILVMYLEEKKQRHRHQK
jgi:hypothetical protein